MSSSWLINLPNAGLIPSVSKYSPVTYFGLCTVLAAPLPLKTSGDVPAKAETLAKASFLFWISRKNGTENEQSDVRTGSDDVAPFSRFGLQSPNWPKPAFGCVRAFHRSKTRSFASLTGIARSSAALIKLKITVFAPIPSASVRIAVAVNPGLFRSVRIPKRKSSYKSSSQRQPHMSRAASFTIQRCRILSAHRPAHLVATLLARCVPFPPFASDTGSLFPTRRSRLRQFHQCFMAGSPSSPDSALPRSRP